MLQKKLGWECHTRDLRAEYIQQEKSIYGLCVGTDEHKIQCWDQKILGHKNFVPDLLKVS